MMIDIDPYQIKQMDSRLLEWLSHKQNSNQLGTVHSVFDKVVNFISHDGVTLFSLAKNWVIQSPGMMKTCEDEGFSQMLSVLKPGMPINLVGNCCLEINDWQWDFSNAVVWERDIASLSQTKPDITASTLMLLNNFIEKYGAREGIFPAWKSFSDVSWEVPETTRKNIYFSPFLAGLEQLVKDIEGKKLENFMDRFVGLGIGLTPSGDDFLTGLLATWQYFAFPLYKDFEPNQADLKGRTTDVSYFMLKHCLEGQVNEALLALLENLDGDPTPQLRQLLAIGSTSGTDMLVGVSFAYQQLINDKEEKQWRLK
ncbi:oxamate carbamoyltransferase subunit AllH family protein [Lentibacillus cibarius]|nr:DUF2877 domain-containing protein [Lentibacillus cibarius]